MAHSSFTGTSVTLREVAVDCPLVADTTILPTHGWFEEKRKKRRKKEIIYFFSFFPFFAKKREGRGKKREQVFLFFSQLLFLFFFFLINLSFIISGNKTSERGKNKVTMKI